MALNSRLIYSTAYSSSPLRYLVGISNLPCPKENCQSPTDLPLSQSFSSFFSGSFILSVTQARNLGEILDSSLAFILTANLST